MPKKKLKRKNPPPRETRISTKSTAHDALFAAGYIVHRTSGKGYIRILSPKIRFHARVLHDHELSLHIDQTVEGIHRTFPGHIALREKEAKRIQRWSRKVYDGLAPILT